MPLKLIKTEVDDKLTINRLLYAKSYSLIIDRKKCIGCDICKTICPKGAIQLMPTPRKIGEKAKAPIVDVDIEKCDYEGICVALCPFGAISLNINGERKIPVVEKESFPEVIRDIEIANEKCDSECKICEDKCPLKIINVKFETLSSKEKTVENINSSFANQYKRNIIEVKKELCPCCRQCEIACPPKVIQVKKFFNGIIKINHLKCPEGCHDCVDVCPVDALYLGDDKKVYPNEIFCIYCRACINVCPQDGALEVKRTSIRHTNVKSGAWNKALEKLTSIEGVKKVLRAKGSKKAVEALKSIS